MHRIVMVFVGLVISLAAHAGGLDGFTEGQTTQALKSALEQGSIKAVVQLGKPNGFLDNPQIRIPLPENLKRVESMARMVGQGDKFDELVTAMNRAAEASVPEAKTLLVNAVKKMSVQDAKTILTGGDDSATNYFRQNSQTQLREKFLPIVTRYTQKLGLAQQYNSLAGQAAGFGLIKQQDANIQDYVTNKALDGLYATIAEQEKSLRSNPLQYTGGIAKKYGGGLMQSVFGALAK